MSLAGFDYISTTIDVSFDPGSTMATVSVPIIDNTDIEGDEMFTVSLTSSDSNVEFGNDMATVTILDRDGMNLVLHAEVYEYFIVSVVVFFNPVSYTVTEGEDAHVTLLVHRRGSLSDAAVITVTPVADSAEGKFHMDERILLKIYLPFSGIRFCT